MDFNCVIPKLTKMYLLDKLIWGIPPGASMYGIVPSVFDQNPKPADNFSK